MLRKYYLTAILLASCTNVPEKPREIELILSEKPIREYPSRFGIKNGEKIDVWIKDEKNPAGNVYLSPEELSRRITEFEKKRTAEDYKLLKRNN
ncbi:hypothetical protein J4436_00070 [Candidatus Woesearchaeota archaeon]|nr:hypothetical protein [Candidatus Woesearchaeota archaeon]